jgi:hypothetical protein
MECGEVARMEGDKAVEGLRITPSESPTQLVEVKPGDQSEEAMLLASTLVLLPPSLLHYVASGVRDREGIAADETGFRYPTDELDPGEEPFEGVKVFNPLGEVEVSVDAFERLMARYLRASVGSAVGRRHPLVAEVWWPDLVRMVDEIEQRTSAAG